MSGPQASPSQLMNPGAGVQSAQALEAQAQPSDHVLALQGIQQQLGGQAAPRTPALQGTPPGAQTLSPEDSAQALKAIDTLLAQRGNEGEVTPANPEQIPFGAFTGSRFAQNPEGQAKIFKHLMPEGTETRVVKGEAQFKPKGDSAWHPIKPGWFDSMRSFALNAAGLAPDVLEGGVQTAAMGLGAAEGALAGAPAGGVGAIPGAVAGAVSAGAGSAALASVTRDAVAQLLGADPDPNLAQNALVAGATGGVLSGAGALVRKPLQVAAQALAERASTGQVGTGKVVGELVDHFNTIYRGLTGKPLPATGAVENATRGEVGSVTASAVEGAYERLGAKVGMARDILTKVNPDELHALPQYQQELEKLLKSDYRLKLKDKILQGEPDVWQAVAKGEPEPGMKRLAQIWEDLKNRGGISTGELYDLHDEMLRRANFGNQLAPSPSEMMFRELHRTFAPERDAAILKASEAIGSPELKGLVNGAIGEYRDNIDMLRALHRNVEKSPERFTRMLLSDSKTAQAAKHVLENPAGDINEGMSGWDALRHQYLTEHMDGVRDAKTGIVDLTKLYDKLAHPSRADVSNVVVGKDAMAQLRSLGAAMDKITWKGLLDNPDSVRSEGVVRALGKFVLSKGNPAFGAGLLGAIAGHDPSILKLVQEKGIMQFAKEAPNMIEQNWWMRGSRMLDRMANAVTVESPLPGSKARIPVEQSMIPVLLRAGVRELNEPAPLQKAHQDYGFQIYQEHQREREAELAQKLQEAKQRGASMGVPMQLAVRRHGGLHLKK